VQSGHGFFFAHIPVPLQLFDFMKLAFSLSISAQSTMYNYFMPTNVSKSLRLLDVAFGMLQFANTYRAENKNPYNM
jgi:hypothetical protein